MKTIRLTVNGEPCSARVAGRTQLAELLRDRLHLTGTHLGCEHGVCGACTVLVDGRPIRSCITCAHACEGADVVTVEGLGNDPTGKALCDAFSRHHALQCGFCTSGMLISAWDIVTRLAPADEATIRRELSGNLCRCTGYMGIVAAVREVALRHRETMPATGGAATVHDDDAAHGPATEPVPPDAGASGPFGADAAPPATAGAATGGEAAASRSTAPPGLSVRGANVADKGGEAAASRSTAPSGPREAAAARAAPFEPFEVDPAHLAAAGMAGAGAARAMTRSGGWNRVERTFAVEQPVDALWALFEDLPRVAGCLPGVRVESADANRFTGRAEIRFGPVSATFNGEGTREADAERRTGAISGRGTDSRGHASLEADLHYAMSGEDTPGPEPRTRVELAIRFRVQGGLAQFDRGDLVESFADVVLAEFARNCERLLAGEELRAGGSMSGLALLWRMIRARLGIGPAGRSNGGG